jgi:hypothetical protein
MQIGTTSLVLQQASLLDYDEIMRKMYVSKAG